MPLVEITPKPGGKPCGECHIRPGETCDICGAVRPDPRDAEIARLRGFMARAVSLTFATDSQTEIAALLNDGLAGKPFPPHSR